MGSAPMWPVVVLVVVVAAGVVAPGGWVDSVREEGWRYGHTRSRCRRGRTLARHHHHNDHRRPRRASVVVG